MSRTYPKMRLGLALLASAAALTAKPAYAVDLQVGSYSMNGLGAEFSSPYDTFSIVGNSLTGVAAPDNVLLGSLTFDVGPNCWSCTLTPSFDAIVDLTVDGVTQQFDLPYAWYSSGPSDFLTFSTPAPVVFDFGSLGLVTVAVDAPATLTSPIGTVYGDLRGTVTTTPVPEPGTYALVISGLGAIGFIARRRRR